MPPQTLWNVKRDAKATFLDIAADRRPFHAGRAAKIIAIASSIDAQMIGVFAEMLGAKAEPAAAIFMALRSASAQTAAIDAIAELVLNEDLAKILSVIQEIILVASVDRNRFAHWLWGWSDDLPDALLLLDPASHRSTQISRTIALLELIQKQGDALDLSAYPDQFDPKTIYVYARSDMSEAEEKIDRANGLIHLFRVVISQYDPLAEKLYPVLTCQREIVDGLERRRNKP